uniref:Uncharacterized protein n=1 Tax=Romanomermis culicivorax TaxID=13658 RepID=A0A915K2A7_ROMCU
MVKKRKDPSCQGEKKNVEIKVINEAGQKIKNLCEKSEGEKMKEKRDGKRKNKKLETAKRSKKFRKHKKEEETEERRHERGQKLRS